MVQFNTNITIELWLKTRYNRLRRVSAETRSVRGRLRHPPFPAKDIARKEVVLMGKKLLKYAITLGFALWLFISIAQTAM
jgi:hypothetical protein